MKRIILYILLPLWLSGCSDRDEQPEPTGETTPVTFSLKVEEMNTRAGEDISELINDLEILAFEKIEDEYMYSYRTAAKETTQENQYTALLRYTDADVRLVLIANHTDFQQLELGYSTEQTMETLLQTFTDAGITYIPMAGEINLPDGIQPETTINDVTLLRSIAAVEIRLGDQLYVDNTFLLRSIQVYRANNRIQVIADPNTVDPDTWEVTLPSVPDAAAKIITTSPADAGGTTNEIPVRMYLPESKAVAPANVQSEATCLIVGGIYRGDDISNTDITYYRIDFKNANQQPTGQILRNHRYNIIITDVTGPGTTHPEEADASSIKTTIPDWEDSDHEIELE